MAGRIKTEGQLRKELKKALLDIIGPCAKPLIVPSYIKPYVIFVAGINGAGKTTTIGKMAAKMKKEGKSVLLAAGDTFRARGRRAADHLVRARRRADPVAGCWGGFGVGDLRRRAGRQGARH